MLQIIAALTFRSHTDLSHRLFAEGEWLLLHEVQDDLFPCLCIRQRNVEPLNKTPPGSFINLVGSVGGSNHQQPVFITGSGSILDQYHYT